jgi:hypothetical protein
MLPLPLLSVPSHTADPVRVAIGQGSPVPERAPPKVRHFALVGINFAERYVSFEGKKKWPTDGKRYKHPIQEAAQAERRWNILLSSLASREITTGGSSNLSQQFPQLSKLADRSRSFRQIGRAFGDSRHRETVATLERTFFA